MRDFLITWVVVHGASATLLALLTGDAPLAALYFVLLMAGGVGGFRRGEMSASRGVNGEVGR